MNVLIVNYAPFLLEQTIFVYQHNTLIKTEKTTIERIPSLVKELSKKFNIKDIRLCGSEDYLLRCKALIDLQISDPEYKVNIIDNK